MDMVYLITFTYHSFTSLLYYHLNKLFWMTVSDILKQTDKNLCTIGETRLTAYSKKVSLWIQSVLSKEESSLISASAHSVQKPTWIILTRICNPACLSHSFFFFSFLTLILTMDSCDNSQASSLGEDSFLMVLVLPSFGGCSRTIFLLVTNVITAIYSQSSFPDWLVSSGCSSPCCPCPRPDSHSTRTSGVRQGALATTPSPR